MTEQMMIEHAISVYKEKYEAKLKKLEEQNEALVSVLDSIAYGSRGVEASVLRGCAADALKLWFSKK
jgi:hypothetical protein